MSDWFIRASALTVEEKRTPWAGMRESDPERADGFSDELIKNLIAKGPNTSSTKNCAGSRDFVSRRTDSSAEPLMEEG